MARTMTLTEALVELKKPEVRKLTVHNWKEMLPPDSVWQPGFPGHPNCKHCHGLGYLRMDLSVRHPLFGRIFVCDCVPEPTSSQIKERIDKLYTRH